jgi:hypothetical protein
MRYKIEMRPNGSIYSVVLGWETQVKDEVECCLIHTTDSKAAEPSATIQRLSWNSFERKKRKLKKSSSPSTETTSSLRIKDSILAPLVQIECRDAEELGGRDDLIIHSDAAEVELILPNLLFREESGQHDSWQYLFYRYRADIEDDQWNAAKRGDLEALKGFVDIDWTEVDDFGNTPLYYACHSGAARDIQTVKFLIEKWPGKLPPVIENRCKTNAVNHAVIAILKNPHDPSAIVSVKNKDFDLYNDSCMLEGWNIFAEDECED